MENLNKMRAGVVHCIGDRTTCQGCPYISNQRCAAELTADLLALIDRVSALDPDWISVLDRMPDPNMTGGERYLICCESKAGRRSVNMAWYDGQTWHGQGSFARVTHWKPLPALPGTSNNNTRRKYHE